MRDGISDTQLKRVISPLYVLNNTPIVGQIIDRQGYDALSFLLATGAIGDADATFAVLVEDGDDAALADAAAVSDDQLISQTPGVAPETAAAFEFDDDNEVRKIGYLGTKQYVRLTVTPTANSVASPALGAYLCVMAAMERASHTPIVQATS